MLLEMAAKLKILAMQPLVNRGLFLLNFIFLFSSRKKHCFIGNLILIVYVG